MANRTPEANLLVANQLLTKVSQPVQRDAVARRVRSVAEAPTARLARLGGPVLIGEMDARDVQTNEGSGEKENRTAIPLLGEELIHGVGHLHLVLAAWNKKRSWREC